MDDEYEKFEDWNKSKNSLSTKLISNLQPNQVILIIAMFFVCLILYQRNAEKFNWLLFVAGGGLVLYIFSLMKKESDTRLIPRRIAQQWAFNDLKKDVGKNKCFKEGTTIVPIVNFSDQSYDDGESGMKVFKYHFGFRIKQPGKSEKDYVYRMNPKTGESKGVEELMMPFTSKDIKDIKIVEPAFIKEEKKPSS